MNGNNNGCPEALTLNERFRKFALCIAHFAGTPIAFMVSFLIIVVWAVVGPIFHFSDSWQLVINTSTTIVTFLMVFLIQNMQNRDAKRSEEHTSELQSHVNLVCRLLLEKKKKKISTTS